MTNARPYRPHHTKHNTHQPKMDQVTLVAPPAEAHNQVWRIIDSLEVEIGF